MKKITSLTYQLTDEERQEAIQELKSLKNNDEIDASHVYCYFNNGLINEIHGLANGLELLFNVKELDGRFVAVRTTGKLYYNDDYYY